MTRCIFFFLMIFFSFLYIPQCVNNICSREILAEYNRSSSTNASFSIALSWELLQSKRALRRPVCVCRDENGSRKVIHWHIFRDTKNLNYAFETWRKTYMSSAVFINAQSCNKEGPPDTSLWITSQLNCDGATEFSSAQSECAWRVLASKSKIIPLILGYSL